jgi:uncharacterized protein YndB with AHSA1/START domain
MKTNNDTPGKFTAAGEIRFQRMLPGPIERVWEYLTDSEKRGRWLATGPMDLSPGGKVALTFQHENLTAHEENVPKKYESACAQPMQGRILRCEPPRLLSHTWGEEDGSESEVTYELTPQGREVLLHLTHRKIGSRHVAISVAAGWHTHVAILIAKLENREPPPFWATHASLETDYARQLDEAPAR